jgi:Arc/MetJ-type ribon-helix-helix transcriptional regulator
MNIRITKPEVEELINHRLQTGKFKDAEDVVFQALQALPAMEAAALHSGPLTKDIVELFAPLRGLNLEFDRNPSKGRSVDL